MYKNEDSFLFKDSMITNSREFGVSEEREPATGCLKLFPANDNGIRILKSFKL